MKDVGEVGTVMTGAGDMITGAKHLSVVEYMKGKEAKGQNGVRNKAKKGKQERCVVMRGYS